MEEFEKAFFNPNNDQIHFALSITQLCVAIRTLVDSLRLSVLLPSHLFAIKFSFTWLLLSQRLKHRRNVWQRRERAREPSHSHAMHCCTRACVIAK